MSSGPARRATVVCAVAIAGLVALALWVGVQDPLPGEDALLRNVVVDDGGWREGWTAVARASDSLPLALVVVVGAAVLLAARRGWAAAMWVAAFAAVWLINPLLKLLVGRARPDVAVLPGSLSEYSFPSGHAANTAVVAGAAVLIVLSVAGVRAGLVVAAVGVIGVAVVGIAQLALGRHYPSDLVAGWLEAVAVLAAVVIALGTVERRRAER